MVLKTLINDFKQQEELIKREAEIAKRKLEERRKRIIHSQSINKYIIPEYEELSISVTMLLYSPYKPMIYDYISAYKKNIYSEGFASELTLMHFSRWVIAEYKEICSDILKKLQSLKYQGSNENEEYTQIYTIIDLYILFEPIIDAFEEKYNETIEEADA